MMPHSTRPGNALRWAMRKLPPDHCIGNFRVRQSVGSNNPADPLLSCKPGAIESWDALPERINAIMHKPTPLALLAVLLLSAASLLGQERLEKLTLGEDDTKGELYIVARKTTLVKNTEEGEVKVASLVPGDLVRTMPTAESAPLHLRWVSVIDRRKTPLVGWVDTRACYHFHKALPAPKEIPESSTPLAELPPLLPAIIRRQPLHIQRAYRDVEATIKRNKELGKQLPEPYFLRARLWTLVKNYDAAVRDYLTAAALVKENRLDQARYATYYEQMDKALNAFDRMPKPIDLGGAAYHYEQGRQAFWSGQFKRALGYFDDAVALDATEPLYWYYRGLTYKYMGNEQRALHDLRLGAHLEWFNKRNRKSSTYILFALERLQGPMRLWLNKIRNGDYDVR
jgi:hypothetical protein